MPRLDMVTGLFFLTTQIDGDLGEFVAATKDSAEQGVYSSPAEAIMAMDRGALSVRAKIKVRLTQLRPPAELETELFGADGWRPGDAWIAETTLGRVLFNELLPKGYPFVDKQMHKKVQARIINDLAERYPMIVVAQTVDKLKDAGFYWATRSGVTVSMADVLVPPEKAEILGKRTMGESDRSVFAELERNPLLFPMVRLIQEELHHFEQVLEIMQVNSHEDISGATVKASAPVAVASPSSTSPIGWTPTREMAAGSCPCTPSPW